MTKPVASSIPAQPVRRVTDLQRSAFWIYGVTAMVMREPLGLIVRHTSEAGLGNWQVRLELLRVAVILLLLSRLFLVSGLYFEQVFMQPESGDRYPLRSYPIDFLAGLMQFLVGAAATTAVASHFRISGVWAPFTLLAALFLLVDMVWLVTAAVRGFSSVPLIALYAKYNGAMLIASVVAWGLAKVAGGDAVLADQSALAVLGVFCAYDISRQVGRYESFDRAA
jgi:hypothetical protein